jgi:hypothetical protein
LSVELLSDAIKFHPNINGIKIDDSEFLISQYADDSTLILEDDTQSLNQALEVVELFSTCSGLRASYMYDKTQAVWIGARRGCGEEVQTNKPIKWNHSGAFKLLSIQYSLHKSDRYIDNFTQKIEKIQRLLGDWSLRKISLIGKVSHQDFGTAYTGSTFYCSARSSSTYCQKNPRYFFNFLWNNKVDKVKRNTVIGNYEDGGLKMPHVLSFVHALTFLGLRESWIQIIMLHGKYY